MASVGFTRSIELIHTGKLTADSSAGLDNPLSPLRQSSKEEIKEMELHTKALLVRQLQLLALQLLSERSTSEAPLMRQRELCRKLTAIGLADVQHSKRLDHILNILTPSRAQDPELLEIVVRFDAYLQKRNLEMILEIAEGMKNPERSKLQFPPEVLEELERRRANRERSKESTEKRPKKRAVAK